MIRLILTATITLSLVAASGCSHKKPIEDSGPADGGVDTGAHLEGRTSDQGNAYGLKTIRFEYDSALLSGDAKSVLKLNADLLKKNPSLHVQIEGHCDQRGGIQYNIALGERRAKSVEHYLVDLGVRADRMTTISYGKERPIDPAETEQAYAKNRRANFSVTQGMI